MSERSLVLLTIAALQLFTAYRGVAGSATWAENPLTGDWNSAENWIPNTVPNGTSDTASFAISSITDVTTSAFVQIGSIIFDATALAFNVKTAPGGILVFDGAGVMNNSANVQTFLANVSDNSTSGFIFHNNATIDQGTVFDNIGGEMFLEDTASAGSAEITVSGSGTRQGNVIFFDNATAANARIVTDGSGLTTFFDDTTASNAVFTVNDNGRVFFSTNSSAEQANIQCIGGIEPGTGGGGVNFDTSATAAESHIVVNGAAVAGALANNIIMADSADGGSATFVANGGPVPGANGATMNFYEDSSGAGANIAINGGSNGGKGARLLFFDHADGGEASINLLGDGQMDIGSRAAPGVTIGSLAGDGLVFLGAKTLIVGSNNQSTRFTLTVLPR